MEYKTAKKNSPDWGEVDVIAESYEKGTPNKTEGVWRPKVGTRADMLKYLQNGERYWYGTDWFGSEKRKNPA